MIEQLGYQFLKRLGVTAAAMLITAFSTPLFEHPGDARALISVELILGGLWIYLSDRTKRSLF